MKKVVLDTNFILSCVKQKIDFFEEINLMGLKIVVPLEVIREIEKVINSKQKLHERENARIAYEIIMNGNFEEIELGKFSNAKDTDGKIKSYARKNPGLIVASLDREVKRVDNRKLVIRGRKMLEIIG